MLGDFEIIQGLKAAADRDAQKRYSELIHLAAAGTLPDSRASELLAAIEKTNRADALVANDIRLLREVAALEKRIDGAADDVERNRGRWERDNLMRRNARLFGEQPPHPSARCLLLRRTSENYARFARFGEAGITWFESIFVDRDPRDRPLFTPAQARSMPFERATGQTEAEFAKLREIFIKAFSTVRWRARMIRDVRLERVPRNGPCGEAMVPRSHEPRRDETYERYCRHAILDFSDLLSQPEPIDPDAGDFFWVGLPWQSQARLDEMLAELRARRAKWLAEALRGAPKESNQAERYAGAR